MSQRMLAAQRRAGRDVGLRVSLVAMAVLLVGTLLFGGGLDLLDLVSERRLANLDRFLGDVRPFPLQGKDWDWSVAWSWGQSLLEARGYEALRNTAAIAVLAVTLAALFGALAAVAASSQLATPRPFGVGHVRRGPSRGRVPGAFGWLRALTRWSLTLMRAIPEYVLAFLLLAVLGSSAWPVVLALAIHNGGILGRLFAETIDNADSTTPRALRGMGAGRLQVAALGLAPALLGRGMLYGFYRFETCVRDATMLGMIGVASLGYWIHDARTGTRYDELVFFVVLGGVLVVLADLASFLVRRLLR